jgi:hypothetical protein
MHDSDPNVLLVVLDCVRARNASLYGYRRETTPTMSSFAETATTYTQARTPAGWSLPAHASILTGVSPATHRMQITDRLEPGHTVFERLAEAGYDTGVFTENPYLTVHASDLRTAFDTVVTEGTEGTPEPDHEDGATGYWYADRFAEWRADRDGEGPWAACVNLMDAHTPYRTREEHDRWRDDLNAAIHADLPPKWRWAVYGGHAPASLSDTLVRLYDGAVRQADDVLGTILEELRRAGEFEDTLVVVTADHGDGFGEPPALDAEPAPLMHGMGTHEVVYHVPLQVKAPGQTDGRRVTALADVSRFPAAVAAATGVEWDGPGLVAGGDGGDGDGDGDGGSVGDLGVTPATGSAGPSVSGDPGWFAPEDGRVVAYLPPANGQEAEKARRHTDDPERYIQELAIVYRDAPGDAVYKRAAWGEDTYTARVVGTAVQDLRPDETAADLEEHPLAVAQAVADATDASIAAPLNPEEARVDKYDNDEEIAAIDVEERLRDLGYL